MCLQRKYRMATILLSADRLRTGRIREVQTLLQPFRERGLPVPCQFVSVPGTSAKLIAANIRTSNAYDYKQWWFPTWVSNIYAQYYEAWSQADAGRKYGLERCYLSLARLGAPDRGYESIVCVHCDPTCAEPEPLRSFKSGPHLHVELAEPPLPKCHFPLNLAQLGEVLSSAETVTRAMGSAVRVITDEVMRQYANL